MTTKPVSSRWRRGAWFAFVPIILGLCGTSSRADADTLPTLTITSPTVVEGNTGTTVMTFTASLSAASDQVVTANYNTLALTASPGSDFVPTQAGLTFAPGDVTKTIAVTINGDLLDENDETFGVILSNVTGAINAQALKFNPANNHFYETIVSSGTFNTAKAAAEARVYAGATGHLATITSAAEQTFINSQLAPVDRWIGGFQPPSSPEPAGGWQWVTGEPFSYTNWTSGEPNNAGGIEDAIVTQGPLTWSDLSRTGSAGGYVVEYDFTTLPAGAADPQGIGTIGNDDTPPSLSVANVTMAAEGQSGTTNVSFVVTLSAASGKTISFNYATANGTATEPEDYTAVSGSSTISSLSTSRTITVAVKGDTLIEPNETFDLVLSNIQNAVPINTTATCTITDDEPPVLTLNSPTVTESSSGTTAMTFVATLSEPSDSTVTVAYTTQNFTATAGADFQATSGTLTFAPGEVSKNITVNIINDTVDEIDETFYLVLSNVIGATYNPSPRINPANNHFYEVMVATGTWNAAKAAAEARVFGGVNGHLATVTSASEKDFLVAQLNPIDRWLGAFQPSSSSEPAGGWQWVTGEPFSYTNWTPGEPNNANNVEDAVVCQANLNWNDLSRTATAAGYVVEYDFTTVPPGVEQQGMGTIIADVDPAPSITIANTSVSEGNSGTVNANFAVTLSGPSGKAISINYATSNITATGGGDYTSTPGTLNIAAGSTSATLSIPVLVDTLPEIDETFKVTLSAPVNATLANTEAVGTIINDDGGSFGPLGLTPADGRMVYTYSENNGGSFRIRIMEADGSNQRDLVAVGNCREAAISGDGNTVVYTSNADGAFDVWIINSDGTNRRRVTSGGGVQPNISRDGSLIVFQRGTSLYLINADGTNERVLVTGGGGEPHFMPDGNSVLFNSDREGPVQIYRVNINGSGLTRLGDLSASDINPAVNPAGTKIAFQSNRTGGDDIYIMNVDGTGVTRLTTDGAHDGAPWFSPDGSIIAFDSLRTGTLNSGIYVMNANGSGQTRLTSTFFSAIPAWGGAGTNPAPSSVVDTTADVVDAGDGVTSLREAIVTANATTGRGIRFNIPQSDSGFSGGVWTIRPTSPLPVLTGNGTILNAATQTTAQGDLNTAGPEIFLSGELAGPASTGFHITGANIQVSGLAIGNFGGAGIGISGNAARSNLVQACYLGTDAAGSPAPNDSGVWIHDGPSGNLIGSGSPSGANLIAGNYGDGIVIDLAGANLVAGNNIGVNAAGAAIPNGGNGIVVKNGATNNSIGGIASGFGNTISGNAQWGIALAGAMTTNIAGNRIGTNTAGTSGIGNGFGGIFAWSAYGVTIGGNLGSARNLVSANAGTGIYLYFTDNAKIHNNYIGTNAAGNAALGNGGFGIWVDVDSSGAAIGSAISSERNIIADNYQGGIYLTDAGTTGTTVSGNYIGVGANGSQALGNGSVDMPGGGIAIEVGARNNTIGGTAAGAGNIIANNIGAGISLGNAPGDAVTGNNLRGNLIYDNSALGINLRSAGENAAGVTANDTNDGDSGPNGLQNYPVLTSVVSANGGTFLQGNLNSTPNATFTVDIFTNPTGDPSGYGEGQTLFASTTATTNASGNASIAVYMPTADLSGRAFSAIATSAAGNTSEFGPAFVALTDTGAPVAAITSPADGTTPETAPPVSGTASDAGGSGVSSVTVALRRSAANGAPEAWYNWTTGNLEATYAVGAHEKTAIGTANWNLALPQSLPGGPYQIRATAIDYAGNRGSSSWVGFTLTDTTAPTATLTAPLNNGLYNDMALATGTAADGGINPSGVAKVTVKLYRAANGATPDGFWAGGGTWTPTYDSGVNEILANGTTSWSLVLPSLAAGSYVLTAHATDVAGNLSDNAAEAAFTIELTPPSVAITTPTAGGIYAALNSANGTAADASGIARVTGRLFRAANGPVPAGYWAGGSTWTPAYSATNERLCTGTSNWSLALPNLPEGNYSLRATATDNAGNQAASTVHSFRINRAASIIAVAQPVPDNVKVKTATVISGVADFSVTQVTCWLYRYANGGTPAGYWAGGNTWTETYSAANERACTGTRNWSLTLPTLAEGNYAFRATATQSDGVKTSTQFMHFTLDGTAPAATVTAPVPENVKLKVVPGAITGTASDAVTGVARVTCWFYRYAKGGTPAGYWNGDATWNGSYGTANELPCAGTTNWSLALPTLPDGNYAFRVTATDGGLNQTVKPIGHFTVDATAPGITVAQPSANANYKANPNASGTAFDAGTGVTRVTGRLFRDANGPTPAGYWAGGTTWTTTYNANNERLCTGTTTWSLTLPVLPDGSYTFRATATDGAGNTTASTVSSFIVDNVAPTLAITQPATEGGNYSAVSALTGTANDSGTYPSGINRVTAWLYRYVNGGTPAGYWAGASTWTAGVNELVCTGTTAWSLTTPALPAGNYAFRVTVVDKAGNSLQSAFRHFTIAPAGSPGIGTSGLSTASARASTTSVTLVYSSALDADSAADAAHYTVTINGATATIESAAYVAASRSVVLTLQSGALRSGDGVVVVWNGVSGVTGSSYSGQTGALTAK